MSYGRQAENLAVELNEAVAPSRPTLRQRLSRFLRRGETARLGGILRSAALAGAVAASLLAASTLRAQSIELSSMQAGHGGFVIRGSSAADLSGSSVSGAGDVNGDGLADLLVGAPSAAPENRNLAGESYVVFGKQNGGPVELSDVREGRGGFAIRGNRFRDFRNMSVAGVGDVNGDGFADVLLGASEASPGGKLGAGESYVVFGKADGSPVELADIQAGRGGFPILGGDLLGRSGTSVAGVADVNGDGLADLFIGAIGAGPRQGAGESYVVFGKVDGSPVNLVDVQADLGGFVIRGSANGDLSGSSVSAAGDVNGDGLADFLVGASRANRFGDNPAAGESYVVFGKTDVAAVELSQVRAGRGGFSIRGSEFGDSSGGSVSGAGDVNGDGLADLLIGAEFASPGGRRFAGESYVVFGKTNGRAVRLSNVQEGEGGFAIRGSAEEDRSGSAVAGIGDLNGDGLADLLIGAYGADPDGKSGAGESYVVFGKADGTAVELTDIQAGEGGIALRGDRRNDRAGGSVSGAGDVNGDGFTDLVIGANGANPGGKPNAGETYVVFGAENLGAPSLFSRGDVNLSGDTDLSDAITIFGFLFLGNPGALGCEPAADTDDSGQLDISDGISLLQFLFNGGTPPAAPFGDCSDDPTPDTLSCENFDACP